MNNPTLSAFCNARLGRADIEGSKSDVAVGAWPPQASYPCGNFSDTSGMNISILLIKGSLASLSRSREVLNLYDQASLYPCVPREISVLAELALGHLRCRVTDMPPQPNSPSARCRGASKAPFAARRPPWAQRLKRRTATKNPLTRKRVGPEEPCVPQEWSVCPPFPQHPLSKATMEVVVFHCCVGSHLYYTPHVTAHMQTGVKLNRVFFPRSTFQVRSLDCCFAR